MLGHIPRFYQIIDCVVTFKRPQVFIEENTMKFSVIFTQNFMRNFNIAANFSLNASKSENMLPKSSIIAPNNRDIIF